MDEEGQRWNIERRALGLARPVQERAGHPLQLGGGNLGFRQIFGPLNLRDEGLAALTVRVDVPG